MRRLKKPLAVEFNDHWIQNVCDYIICNSRSSHGLTTQMNVRSASRRFSFTLHDTVVHIHRKSLSVCMQSDKISISLFWMLTENAGWCKHHDLITNSSWQQLVDVFNLVQDGCRLFISSTACVWPMESSLRHAKENIYRRDAYGRDPHHETQSYTTCLRDEFA